MALISESWFAIFCCSWSSNIHATKLWILNDVVLWDSWHDKMMLVLLSLEELRHVSFHQQKSIQSTCNVSLRKASPHNCWASAGFWLMNQLKSDEIKMNQLEAIKIGSREAKSRLGAMFSEESGFCWSGNNLWKQFFSRATSWWAAAASFIWRASGALSPLPTLKKTTFGWFFTSDSKGFLGSFWCSKWTFWTWV